MSIFYISIDQVDFEKSIKISLDRFSAKTMFKLLIEKISDKMNMQGDPEWQEDFQLTWDVTESQSLEDLPNDIFNYAYQIIMRATKEHQELQPYAQELKEKLEADPRFDPNFKL